MGLCTSIFVLEEEKTVYWMVVQSEMRKTRLLRKLGESGFSTLEWTRNSIFGAELSLNMPMVFGDGVQGWRPSRGRRGSFWPPIDVALACGVAGKSWARYMALGNVSWPRLSSVPAVVGFEWHGQS